jgi:hypothetical protein
MALGQVAGLLLGGSTVEDKVAGDLSENALAPVGVVQLDLGDRSSVSRSGSG